MRFGNPGGLEAREKLKIETSVQMFEYLARSTPGGVGGLEKWKFTKLDLRNWWLDDLVVWWFADLEVWWFGKWEMEIWKIETSVQMFVHPARSTPGGVGGYDIRKCGNVA